MELKRIFPERTNFFALFYDAAVSGEAAAHLLTDLFAGRASPDHAVPQLRDLAHQTEAMTHEIVTALDHNLVTPLSHKTIRSLAVVLYDFTDDIATAGQRAVLYRLLPATEPAQGLARIILAQASTLATAILLLKEMNHYEALAHQVAELLRLKQEADDDLNRLRAELYEGVYEPPATMRASHWDEVLGLIEDALDLTRQAANTLQIVVEQRR